MKLAANKLQDLPCIFAISVPGVFAAVDGPKDRDALIVRMMNLRNHRVVESAALLRDCEQIDVHGQSCRWLEAHQAGDTSGLFADRNVTDVILCYAVKSLTTLITSST